MWQYACERSTCGGQEGLCLDSLELELQAIRNCLVWVLVTELRPSEIVVNALNYLQIFLPEDGFLS